MLLSDEIFTIYMCKAYDSDCTLCSSTESLLAKWQLSIIFFLTLPLDSDEG